MASNTPPLPKGAITLPPLPQGAITLPPLPAGAVSMDDGSSAAAPQAPQKPSQILGFEQGIGNFLANGAELPIQLGEKLGLPMETFRQGQAMERNPQHEANVVPGKIGRFGADVLESAPLSLTMTGIPGMVAGGAITGALTGDKDSPLTGAVMGAGTAGVLGGAGKALSPQISKMVQMLARNGVQMTPGQIFGGMTKGVEDRLAGLPLVGDFISSAQRASRANFFTGGPEGGINSALAPLARVGGKVPAGPGLVTQGHDFLEIPKPPTSVPAGVTGHDAVKFAGDTLNDAYDSLLPHTSTVLTPDFWNGVHEIVTNAKNNVLPDHATLLNNTVKNVFGKIGALSDNTQITGHQAQDLNSEFNDLARTWAGSSNPNEKILSKTFGEIRDAIRNQVSDSNPNLAPQLTAINEGWRNLVPIELAAGKAPGSAAGVEAGVPTPAQYRQAIGQALDQSVRKRGMARGTVTGQKYAEAGINVIPSSVADSGTAGRLALPAMIAAALANPALLLKAAAVPLMYSNPGLKIANALFAHGAGPLQKAAGTALQKSAVPMAGAVSGQYALPASQN